MNKLHDFFGVHSIHYVDFCNVLAIAAIAFSKYVSYYAFKFHQFCFTAIVINGHISIIKVFRHFTINLFPSHIQCHILWYQPGRDILLYITFFAPNLIVRFAMFCHLLCIWCFHQFLQFFCHLTSVVLIEGARLLAAFAHDSASHIVTLCPLSSVSLLRWFRSTPALASFFFFNKFARSASNLLFLFFNGFQFLGARFHAFLRYHGFL